MAEEVFTMFASEMTFEGLTALLDILAKPETVAGQSELFDPADEGAEVEEGEEDSEVNDDEIKIDSDVEVVDGATDAGVEDDSDEEKESSDGEENEEELAKFNVMLAETLSTSNAAANGEEEDTSDGEDMDDEQMMALEPHLASIFKQRNLASSKKKDKKDAKENMVNFKNRVLDLLLIYVKQEHANSLALQLILPTLQLMRSTSTPQMANKAASLLKTYFDQCRSKGHPDVEDQAALTQLMKDIHLEAMSRSSSKLHGGTCSRASLFIVKVMVSADERNYGEAVDIYAETQKKWFASSKSEIQPAFFTEWVSWSINSRKGKQG